MAARHLVEQLHRAAPPAPKDLMDDGDDGMAKPLSARIIGLDGDARAGVVAPVEVALSLALEGSAPEDALVLELLSVRKRDGGRPRRILLGNTCDKGCNYFDMLLATTPSCSSGPTPP